MTKQDINTGAARCSQPGLQSHVTGSHTDTGGRYSRSPCHDGAIAPEKLANNPKGPDGARWGRALCAKTRRLRSRRGPGPGLLAQLPARKARGRLPLLLLDVPLRHLAGDLVRVRVRVKVRVRVRVGVS
eukprot:scaffold17813_cov74-Phaeocystis_antarctica.AAC.2